MASPAGRRRELEGNSQKSSACDFGAQHDLLPLPRLPSFDEWHGEGHVGRRLRQRVDRESRFIRDANDAVDAFNWCYGAEEPSRLPSTTAQREALRHIVRTMQSEPCAPAGVETQAAVTDLLGTSPGYGGCDFGRTV